MSVTLLNPLPDFAFSNNSILVTLSSDDLINTAGVAAVNRITFSGGAIANGNSIQLVWSKADLTMTAAAAPDNSGKQFPAGDGSAGYVASLVQYFNWNPYLNRDYVITAVGSTLVFTARATGIDFNIVPAVSGNMTLTVPTSGINQVFKPNFKHWLEIWMAGVRVYARSLGLEPNTGITTKDLKEVLHAELFALGSDRPDLAANNWQACANTIQPYFIKYAQYYGDTPEIKRIYQSPVAYVNRGGLDIATAPGITLKGFIAPAPDRTLCLRQGSKKILVQADQPEWLYWINLTGAAVNIQTRVEIFYNDGSASTVFLMPVVAAAAGAKYYTPAGFKTLDIRGNMSSGKICSRYAVRLMNSDTKTYLSAEYNYYIDRYREWPRFFVYLNSLGGYQTLYTRGKGQPKTTRTKLDINSQVTDEQAARSGRNKETDIRIQRRYIVNTGFTTAREIALLDDFLVSRERYRYDNGRLTPIGLSTDELTQAPDGENLQAGQFEYYPMYENVVFTDDPAQEDGTVAGNGDGSAGGGASAGYNAIIDDGENFDNLFYDNLL